MDYSQDYLQKIIESAKKLRAKGNLQDAENQAKEAIKLKYDLPNSYILLAAILLDKQSFKLSEDALKKSIQLNPYITGAYLNLGLLKKRLGSLESAFLCLGIAIDLDPNDSKLHLNLGILLAEEGKLDSAELAIRRSLDLGPDFALSYFHLGQVLKLKGRLDEAIKSIERSIELQSNLIDSYLILSNIYKELDRFDLAIDYCKKGIGINPSHPSLNLNLGAIYLSTGELDKSEFYTRRSIELDKSNLNARSNLCLILVEQNRLEEAHRLITDMLKNNPNNDILNLNLGRIFHLKNEYNKAQQCMIKSIQLSPYYVDSYSALSGLLVDIGNLNQAKDIIYNAVKLDPYHGFSYLHLGTIYQHIGKLDSARKALIHSLKVNNKIYQAYYLLSRQRILANDNILADKLLSIDLSKIQSPRTKIDLLFTLSNFYHDKKLYTKSSDYLRQANDLKLTIYPSDLNLLLAKSRETLSLSEAQLKFPTNFRNENLNIFIVGMPRSGSTLVSSILGVNPTMIELGETSLLEESLFECQENNGNFAKAELSELYNIRSQLNSRNLKSTIDKNLLNYMYCGLICKAFRGPKIIHCIRNPLDNILSIYRANFSKSFRFSSSLADCALFYKDYKETMRHYTSRFPSSIYTLQYEKFTTCPEEQIKLLVNWLGLEWSDSYLHYYLKKRPVYTASDVQVRSPISTKSIGSSSNYSDLLKPIKSILYDI